MYLRDNTPLRGEMHFGFPKVVLSYHFEQPYEIKNLP